MREVWGREMGEVWGKGDERGMGEGDEKSAICMKARQRPFAVKLTVQLPVDKFFPCITLYLCSCFSRVATLSIASCSW